MNCKNSIYEFYNLPREDQKEFLGEWIEIGDRQHLVVHTDEWTESWGYQAQYSLISVHGHTVDGVTTLHVLMPSRDDSSMRADFKPSAELNLSTLTELIQEWAKRINYSYVNVHALADYCIYLGASRVDWG